MMVSVPFRLACGLICVAALVLSGCGQGGKPTGTVSGTVSHKGTPLTSGNVNLISKSGSAAIAKIDEQGRFKVDGAVVAGDYTAYATAPIPEPQAPGSKPAAKTKFELPAKFRDPATSGVTVTVNAGSNDLPIEFKD
jgi:hypothetical protein